jgi:hypothetical protein
MWVLFDASNIDYPVKKYLWAYDNKEMARERKYLHDSYKSFEKLIGPFNITPSDKGKALWLFSDAYSYSKWFTSEDDALNEKAWYKVHAVRFAYKTFKLYGKVSFTWPMLYQGKLIRYELPKGWDE